MRAVLALGVLCAAAAWAHDADVVYVLLSPGGPPGVLTETVTLTAATLSMLAPLDADGDHLLSQGDLDAKDRALQAGVWDEMPLTAAGQRCERLDTGAFLRDGFLELRGHFRCAQGELRQDFRFLRVLPANYRVVLGSQLDGEGSGRGFAQGSLTTITVPRPPPPGSWDEARFRAAFEAGVGRGLSPEAWGALFAVLLSMAAWRRGLLGLGLGLLSLALFSGVAGGWVAPTAVLLLVAVGGAATKAPPLVLAAICGAALGARGGGGAWPSVLGVAAGSVLVLAPAGLVALALGVMLRRRPRVFRLARWVPVVCVLVGAWWGRSRLSW